MILKIRQNLSQISFLAVTAASLFTAGNAFASPNTSAIDSDAVSQQELYAPGALDERFVDEQLASEYTPLDGAYADDRRRRDERSRRGHLHGEVMACYARDWRGQAYVAYNEELNARRTQRYVLRYCEQQSLYRCQALGCRLEWGR